MLRARRCNGGSIRISGMRFFGSMLQWLGHDNNRGHDDSPDAELIALRIAFDNYSNHIDSLQTLPQELKAIAHPFYVDDALFVQAVYEPKSARLKLVLRCGNIPDGYFDLILQYEGVEIDQRDLAELERAAREAGTDVGYVHDAYCHEFDMLSDGRIEHGFIFHGSWDADTFVPPALFTIRCNSLTYQRVERPDRRLPRVKDRFRIA